jgi:hypothetical protein
MPKSIAKWQCQTLRKLVHSGLAPENWIPLVRARLSTT